MVKLTMEPVTRIEGHAKITVHLDESGNVEDTRLHVMEFRGFEKFLQGRNIEEVPRIVPRICGICDVQHHFAAAKAVDQIFGFKDDEILPAAYKMREIMNWGSFMHSHALHFYFLAAPDLIIPDGTRKTRNVFQVIKDMPEIALQAIKIRRNGLDMVTATGGRPIHPTSSTPGGISTELDEETQADLLAKAKENVELAQATLDLAKPIFEEKLDLVKTLGYFYRVAPLSRINVCDKMPDCAPGAQAALEEFRDLFGYGQYPLLFHWARLIELLASAECAVDALEQDLSGDKVPEPMERVAGEAAGIVEAARGTLIHHYKTDDNGQVTNANIVVATIQNNPAMEMGIQQVAKDYIKPGVEVDDKIFNLMEMVIRAYDPCLSCATHTMDSQMRLSTVEVYDSEGNLMKKI